MTEITHIFSDWSSGIAVSTGWRTFNAYTQAFNLQPGRTGTLFEGRFRHKCVATHEYLTSLCRYIHLNPVKAGLARRPEDWAFSNHCEWIGLRNSLLMDRRFMDDQFPIPGEYRKFTNDMQDEKTGFQKISEYVWD